MNNETLAKWLAHLEALHPRGAAGIELGLDRVRRVKEALAQQQSCPLILVGGTNGKGSTCAFLERILLAAGYRVGLYTSPHLLRYNERVRIDGRPADDLAFCRAFARVEAARKATATPLTYFEFGTLAAWEIFSCERLDAVILEVGLGGRLDATNVYEPDCSVITGVALDHTDYLGPTRAAIAREKAGIARKGRPLVCGDADPPASLADACQAIGAELWRVGERFGYRRQEKQWQYWDARGRRLAGLPYPALRGACQLANASCAIAALSLLSDRLPVSAQEIRQGLLETTLAGRFQIIPGRPQIVLDVAHNPQAAATLAENLAALPPARRSHAIFGVMADKDLAGIIAPLRSLLTTWHVVPLPAARAADPSLLQARIEAEGGRVRVHPSVADALRQLQEEAEADDRIVAFGSFLVVAAALEHLGRTQDGW